ncbi:MAG: hypothetical protein ABI585_04805 [Betaproteobacteria bacterium]
MTQRQDQDKSKSGSADIETGKPQDMRDQRHPGERGTSQNPQPSQQNHGGKDQHAGSQHGSGDSNRNQPQQHEKGSQFGDRKTGGQQQTGNQDHGRSGSGQQGQSEPSSGNKQYGEGNYAASKDYNDRTKQFVESGRVDQAAKDAAPKNEQESREMKDAEREGRRPMREEDPAINPDKSKKPGQGPDTRQ